MQLSILPMISNELPIGYVRFYPDVPTEIHIALGGFWALQKIGAHNVLSSDNALQFEVCASNGVTMVHVSQNIHKSYDIYFYNSEGDCVSYSYCVPSPELAGVFRAGTGSITFRQKKLAPYQLARIEEAVSV